MLKKVVIPVLLFSLTALLSSYTYIFCKRQGIKGHVFRVKGNQMPSPDVQPAPPQPFQTTVYIYELTNTSQVTAVQQSAFYSSIKTRLVKQVTTDKKGYFKVQLEPGNYSLFIKKGELFYANLYDEKNNIAPVTVTKKKFTDLDIKADYDAVY